MSNLMDEIGDKHQVASIESTSTKYPGIMCRCDDSLEIMGWRAYATHVAQVTEREVRSQVATDIREQHSGPGVLGSFASDRAARIAEGDYLTGDRNE